MSIDPHEVLRSVFPGSVVRARRGTAIHLWCKPVASAYTMCGKDATRMQVLRAHVLFVGNDYWQILEGKRFEAILKRITCSSCTSRYIAMRLLDVDGEQMGIP